MRLLIKLLMFTRYCKTTDWARARGAYYNTNSSYLYNGHYCTRSPSSRNSCYTWNVDFDGHLNYDDAVHYTNYSVRPALKIKIA